MKRILFILTTTLFLLLPALQVSAQTDPFTKGLEQANRLFTEGKYDAAMQQLDIIRPAALTTAQAEELAKLYHKCQVSKTDEDKSKPLTLILSSTQTGVLAEGGEFSVGYEVLNEKKTKKKTAVTANADPSSSSWIFDVTVDEKTSLVHFKIQPSDVNMQRIGQVIVKKGALSQHLTVVQFPKEVIKRTVVFSTTPKQATIFVNGTQLSFDNLSGEYDAGKDIYVTVTKSGYDEIVSNIHIDEAAEEQTPLIVPFVLTPHFGLVRFEVIPEEGFDFNPDLPKYQNYTVRLNSEEIKLDPDSIKSFDDYEKEMKFYKAYADSEGVTWIPVDYDGEIRYKITAPGYFDCQSTVSVGKGEKKVIPVTLQARTGQLSVLDEKRSDGAAVFMDGKKIGTLPIVNLRVAEGEHEIKIEKDHHIPMQESYPVKIENGESVEIYTAMRRVAEYKFVTTPAYDELYIDGVLQSNRGSNKYQLVEKPENAPYNITLIKKGYMPFSGTLELSESDFGAEVRTFPHEFARLFALEFKGDEPGLKLDITDKKGKEIMKSIDLPATVHLPLSKSAYQVKLWRSYSDGSNPQKITWKEAYRGRMRFASESKKKHSVITDSRNDLRILDLNLNLSVPNEVFLGEGENTFSILPRVDASFIKFKVLPGWTTSVLKAGLFTPADNPLAKHMISVPEDQVKNAADASFKTIGLLPAVSALFLNDEFRIGGRVTDYATVCALGRYTWYPDFIKQVVKFNHFAGHEIFLGGEVATRLPVISLSLRAGMLMYASPVANIYNKNINPSSKDLPGYWSQKLDIPNMLVISVGVSFGTDSVKGNNVLTLFRAL